MATLNRILPFSADVYFRLFERYMADTLPAQLVGFALALLVIVLAQRSRPDGDRMIAAILAAFWLWTGIVWQVLYFTAIYWASWAFGALFALQAVLLLWRGTLRARLRFTVSTSPRCRTGLAIAVFGLAIYPLVTWLAGHGGPAAPGGAPTPTVLFTFGILLLAEPRIPVRLMIIPVLWSLIGGAAALLLAIPEDLALPLAAVIGLVLALVKNRRAAITPTPAGGGPRDA